MTIKDIFTSEIAIKLFYAYLAVSLGNTGLEVVDKVKPDVIVEKVSNVEKRLERMESLIIELIKHK